MMNFEVSKDNTVTKIKSKAKAELTEMFLEFLKEKLGDENVRMVRTGNASKTNEIGFCFGSVKDGNNEYPICATFSPTVKDFVEKKTKNKVTDPFDLEEYGKAYDDYIIDKENKANEKKESVKKATKETKKEIKIEEVEDDFFD